MAFISVCSMKFSSQPSLNMSFTLKVSVCYYFKYKMIITIFGMICNIW